MTNQPLWSRGLFRSFSYLVVFSAATTDSVLIQLMCLAAVIMWEFACEIRDETKELQRKHAKLKRDL